MKLLEQVDSLISAEMERWEVPGLSIGLLLGNQLETAGFGIANRETGVKTTPDTLFQIGSISKVFTTTLLMKLVDDGLVKLDAPVIRYLPDFKLVDQSAAESITVRHLVTHMSGFYGDRFDDHGRGDDALARAVAAMSDLPQQTVPGELWTYCNAGFDVVGRVIETVLGARFEDAMRQYLFDPLGLELATHFPDEAIRHAVAVGHSRPDGDNWEVAAPWPIPRRSNPAGGISATAADLLRFARMHLANGEFEDKRIISRSSATAMRTQQTVADYGRNWGLGWSLRNLGGVGLAEHSGATNGFMARLTVIPERKFALAVLTNNEVGSQVHSALLGIVMDRLLGLKVVPAEQHNITATEFNNLAGKYEHLLGRMEIANGENGPELRRQIYNPFADEWVTRPPARLAKLEKDVLVVGEGDAKGIALEILRHRSREIRFIRTGGRLAYPVKDWT